MHPRAPLRLVLAPTDFSDVSVETVARARELAEHFGADLLVLHVIPPIPTLPSDPHYNFEVPAYQEALRENARRKLERKNLDWIVANSPDAIGAQQAAYVLLGRDGTQRELGEISKARLAAILLDVVGT